jgi:hypothetical protein
VIKDSPSVVDEMRRWAADGLQFADVSIRQLDALAEYFPSSASHPLARFVDKVTAETGLLVYVAARVGESGLRPTLASITRRLAPHVRANETAVAIMRNPHYAAALSMGHIALTSAGATDPQFDAIVSGAFANRYFRSVEQPAFREAEVAWLQGLRNGCHSIPPEVIESSLLLHPPHPIYASRNELYALTHDVMYCTDFGARELDITVRALADLHASLDACLSWAIAEDDLDLVGELVIARVLANGGMSPAVVAGLQMIRDGWFGDPLCVPGPCFDTEEHKRLSGICAAGYAFRECYHTTYVAGILGYLAGYRNDGRWSEPTPALVAGCEPDLLTMLQPYQRVNESTAPIATRGADVPLRELGALAELMLGEPLAQDQWLTTLSACDLGSREALAVLTDCLIIEACRNYDLAVLARTMATIPLLGLPISPTLVAAVRFLLAQDVGGGYLGAQFLLAENRAHCAAPDVIAALRRALAEVAVHLEAGWSSSAVPTAL